MKKLFALSSLAAVALLSPSTTHATPYASAVTNNAGTINFILNENADNVKVIFNSGASTNDLGALLKGSQSFSLDTATNYQIVVRKVSAPGWKARSGTNTTAQQISSDTNPTLNVYAPRGLAVNKNPKSPYFGRIYIANDGSGTTSTHVIRTTSSGIYVLNADQTDALGQGDTGLNGGLVLSTASDSNPYHIRVGEDDNLYITDWSDATGNLYRTDPDVSAGSGVFALQPLTGAATVPVGTANTHGSVAACYVSGSQTNGNLKIYTIDEDLQSDKTQTTKTQINSLWVYDVDGGTLPYNSDATKLWTPSGTEGIGFTSVTMDLDRAPDGKFFIMTLRSNGSEAGLIVRDSTGATTLFNSRNASVALGGTVDYLKGSDSVAVSFDGKWMAAQQGISSPVTANKVWMIPLTNGIPDLSRRAILADFTLFGSTRQVAFDAADNLYAVNNGEESMRIFSPGGTTTATYSNDITGTSGAFNLVTVEPDLYTQPVSQTKNAGTSTTFSVVASGTGAFTYQWRKNGVNITGATAATLVLANTQQTNAADYSVVVTNLFSSITSSNATLTVVETLPIITTQPASKTVPSGSNVVFSVVTTGSDPRYYQWRIEGVGILNATNTSYTKTNAQPGDSGNYSVTISNYIDIVTSADALLTVTNTPPIFYTQAAKRTVGAGASTTFTAAAFGDDPRFYQWQLGGIDIPGATAASYTRTNVQIGVDDGNYTLVVSNALNVATSTNALLTITNRAPVIATQPKNATNVVGTSVTFSVVASGTDPISYQWSSSSGPITDATNSSYTISSVQVADAGSYSVFLSNSVGNTNSSTVVLTVIVPAPVIQPLVGAGTSSNIVTWSSVSNMTYRVQYKSDLNTVGWVDIVPDVLATSSTTSVTNDPGVADQQYYRVILLP